MKKLGNKNIEDKVKALAGQTLIALGLGLSLLLPSGAVVAEVKSGSLSNMAGVLSDLKEVGGGDGVVVLPREVSEKLDIKTIPTPTSAGIRIGTYWDCYNHSSGHEICRIKLVACTDDQSFCVEV
ncbi:hypothetical protein FKG94_11980 [Exilibacterium tricleocarpae]|uniref:Uncharacterized protein n=1 Tax=Exilibacterium tricleocarpae TaxID=2591008 RepID=A0A545TNF5_9GAMM|nr:hypothetical protein [Exilibacterium tricleocarpae]TQV78736.1 hypothetical protein FKG94_11980 [Exilibacterium tricleocarpae]